MSYYLFQATYTREAIATMVQNPQDRAQAVRAVIEKAGGRVEGFWFAFGEYDTVEIIDCRIMSTRSRFLWQSRPGVH